jgi:hypothetical protein
MIDISSRTVARRVARILGGVPSALCIDPGGIGIRYCIEQYIPDPTAWSFRGDNRGSMPDGGSYRAQQLISNGPDGQLRWSTTAGVSHWGPIELQGNQGPHSVTRLQGAGFTIINAVNYTSNAFLPSADGYFRLFSAPFAWHNIIIFRNGLSSTIYGSHSSYPNLEIWEYGDDTPRLIYNYTKGSKGPSDIGGTPVSIPLRGP